ncbi:MAG: hypothetical protein U0871_12945 [Gemmataceae bacterium]
MTPAADLGLIVPYFNPAGYRTKRANYDRFRAALPAGLPTVVVECGFADAPFDLPAGNGVFHVRGRDVMWQKERLLNLALARLPAGCPKVAWLDADLLFDNTDWAAETSAALDRWPVVQPFDRAVRLARGSLAEEPGATSYPGFAAVYGRHPQHLLSGDFARHGHTGFAWAARREVLADGLYDACIAGSGDHMMAHAFCGDWDSTCVDRIIGAAGRHRAYFARWASAVYSRVRGRVGFVPGAVLHLWHGEVADRRYVDRNRELAGFGFDPARDIRIGASGCWEWASRKPALHRWAADYFRHRQEDGEPVS